MAEFHIVSKVDEGLPPGMVAARAKFIRITGICRTVIEDAKGFGYGLE